MLVGVYVNVCETKGFLPSLLRSGQRGETNRRCPRNHEDGTWQQSQRWEVTALLSEEFPSTCFLCPFWSIALEKVDENGKIRVAWGWTFNSHDFNPREEEEAFFPLLAIFWKINTFTIWYQRIFTTFPSILMTKVTSTSSTVYQSHAWVYLLQTNYL